MLAKHNIRSDLNSIVFLFFIKNLIEKPLEKEVTQENALTMIQCKVVKHLEVLEGQKIEDEDISEDIEMLQETLHNSMHDLR